MKCKHTYDDIKCIDVDISNICNLKCPLCAQNAFNTRFEKQFADVDLLMSRIKQFRNAKTLQIAGAASEPTLHPKLFDFIEKASEYGLTVNLSTNGSTHDAQYWKDLAQLMKPEFKTLFTACGTIQALHGKYRVGSSLELLMDNARSYRDSTSNRNDYVQYIKFQYNSFETNAQILDFFKDFSHISIMNSDCTYERANIGKMSRNDGICLPTRFQAQYSKCIQNVMKKGSFDICCNSFENGIVQMDPFGRIYPCSAWRIFNHSEFDNDGILDYSSILLGQHRFCLECDKHVLEFLDSQDVDTFYMCSDE